LIEASLDKRSAAMVTQSMTPNPPAVSCDQVLRIAQHDASKAYHDLSRYRITLFLADDGWHVDYDLARPLVAGGGPHYVIDAATGEIRHKRYEQ
jgi:hypothetical protein